MLISILFSSLSGVLICSFTWAMFLEDLGNCGAWAKTSHSYGKATWVGLQIVWGRVYEDLQGEANSVSQIDGVSDLSPDCQLCGSVEGGSEKVHGLYMTFCLEEGCPAALALMPDTSVSPCIPLMPFNMVPWCWSSEEWVWVSPLVGSLRGAAWDSMSFFHWLSLHWFLQPEVWGLSLWNWNPGLGSWCGARTPHS